MDWESPCHNCALGTPTNFKRKREFEIGEKVKIKSDGQEGNIYDIMKYPLYEVEVQGYILSFKEQELEKVK